MKRKKESTTSNKIADSLREEISLGKLNPGNKIIEREIAERYKASHIPVREALRILEGEGFVVHRKFAGYTVRRMDPEEIIEQYAILRFLSVQLLSRSIPRYTEITYYHLRSITKEMEKTRKADQSIELLMQFAETAYFPAGLNFTFRMALRFLRRNLPVIRGILEKSYNGSVPVTQFNRFIGLCQKQDAEKAIEMSTEQLDMVTKIVVEYLTVNQ